MSAVAMPTYDELLQEHQERHFWWADSQIGIDKLSCSDFHSANGQLLPSGQHACRAESRSI